MSILLLSLLLGFVARAFIITDLLRPRIQGLSPGEEIVVELQLHGAVNIAFLGNSTAVSYTSSAILLHLTINLSGNVSLRIGINEKTDVLPIGRSVEVKLRHWHDKKFYILIDGNLFYEGPGGFASVVRYTRIFGSLAVTNFLSESRLQIKDSIAHIGLQLGETLNLGFDAKYPHLALLDDSDNQNLYLYTDSSYVRAYKNVDGTYYGDNHIYNDRENGVIVELSNRPEGIDVAVNDKKIVLFRHLPSIANEAYTRLYIDPKYLPNLKNITITKS
ncbi:unnamed protein product [Bursaphelenchus xylophilus]|uniref:(pine wood nematode) hypothetical protein n=1 Tax=Bursaphelenchus xylophilus TaxID=6326 RepID=A0A1I7S2Q0_BURXY|nr:unnamed protein product [Bursaphelenchus xylophilus]CAG9121740.1 unnamed protein product [Bursaphelenchus xylophilus]